MTSQTCALCGRTLTVDSTGYLGDGRLACVVVQACEARRADAGDRETPAERRAALMSAMEGGYAAPEDFGPVEACDGFTGGNAWGACAKCGKRLEDHDA